MAVVEFVWSAVSPKAVDGLLGSMGRAVEVEVTRGCKVDLVIARGSSAGGGIGRGGLRAGTMSEGE